jgi:C-terminal processing protease CtpA/Prc
MLDHPRPVRCHTRFPPISTIDPIPFMRLPFPALVAALVLAPAARAQSIPVNPGFEEGAPTLAPWAFNTLPQYAAVLDSAAPHGGRWAARVIGQAGGPPSDFGNLLQATDAAPLRGKRVRYRAWVRTELPVGASRSGLWLRVDRPGGRMGFFDNMNARPIMGTTGWRAYEIVGDVATDATGVTFGMLLVGAGQAWLDDATVEVIGDAPRPEAARPLTERGVENLVAFTRLLGYVRWFHPSDQAAATDWNDFAAAGMRAAEGAPNPARLAAVLDSLFRPIAPTVAVHVGVPRETAEGRDAPRGDSIRWWWHLGVGLAERSIYRSVRLSHAVGDGPLPDSIPDPRRPLRVRLGGGVSAVIPLSLYTQGGATLPRAALAESAGPSVPGTGDDRATRLAAVAIGWNVFQHFYPYFDVVDADWGAELPRALRTAATDADECAFLATLRRMVAALDDGHGSVRHACEGPLLAPAVRVDMVEGRPTVTGVGAGVEGIRPGDVVVRVDGMPADSLLRVHAELTSAATPGWRDYVVSSRLLMGRDSVGQVTVERAGGETATVPLRRGPPREVPEAGKPEPVAQLRPGIWYVDLDRVTEAQLQAAVPELERATGIVFDLRGYPDGLSPVTLFSHLIREPVASARWIVPVTTRPDHDGVFWQARERWDLRPAAPYLAAPRVWITDGSAISYAESVMGIVEAYRLGEIVGEPTAGTNGNVNPLPLPGGYGVGWTGMRVLKHDESRHHGVGIQPTVPVQRTRAGVAAGRDELIEAALDVLARASATAP